MITNYQRGRNKEYRLKKKYEKLEYIVCRTAGSHSPFDLICVKNLGFIVDIKFIQSKPRKFSDKERRKLYEKFRWLNSANTVKVEFLVE